MRVISKKQKYVVGRLVKLARNKTSLVDRAIRLHGREGVGPVVKYILENRE